MKRVHIIYTAILFLLIGSTSLVAQSVDQGIQLFNGRKYSEAKAILLPYGENDAAAAYYLGRIMMTEDTDDKAAQWFERAVQMSPRNSTYSPVRRRRMLRPPPMLTTGSARFTKRKERRRSRAKSIAPRYCSTPSCEMLRRR